MPNCGRCLESVSKTYATEYYHMVLQYNIGIGIDTCFVDRAPHRDRACWRFLEICYRVQHGNSSRLSYFLYQSPIASIIESAWPTCECSLPSPCLRVFFPLYTHFRSCWSNRFLHRIFRPLKIPSFVRHAYGWLQVDAGLVVVVDALSLYNQLFNRYQVSLTLLLCVSLSR